MFCKTHLTLLTIFTLASISNAKEIAFDEIWSGIKSNSSAQESSRLEERSVLEANQRAAKHWLPKLYLDARTYQTNDPGSSFFGLLEQRKVLQSDFAPDTLNHPEAQTYTRGALGIDLPLYEGGAKTNQVSMLEHSLQSRRLVVSQVEIEQYAQAGMAYGANAVLRTQVEKLETIKSDIEKLIKSYQIGQKSNPVGYSGLLGLKSLSNRINGLIEQYNSQKISFEQTLVAMGWARKDWNPEKTAPTTFLEKYFTINQETTGSPKIKASEEEVKAALSAAEMETARNRPRIGAFAESYAFAGKRDSSDGYSVGLYLQWSLFDPSESGKSSEARLRAQAAAKKVEAFSMQEKAEYLASRENDKAIQSNLKLLEDSDKLLNEQMQVATTLFKNGSITALQLVEILNRRTDLISQQSDLQLALLKNATAAITKTDFQIPFQARSGGTK